MKVRHCSHQPPLTHLHTQDVDSQPQSHPQVSKLTIIRDTLLFYLNVNIFVLRLSIFLGVRSLDALCNLRS